MKSVCSKFNAYNLLLALAATLVVRFTLYAEDCNLLVLGITFLLIFGAVRLVMKMLGKIFPNCLK